MIPKRATGYRKLRGYRRWGGGAEGLGAARDCVGGTRCRSVCMRRGLRIAGHEGLGHPTRRYCSRVRELALFWTKMACTLSLGEGDELRARLQHAGSGRASLVAKNRTTEALNDTAATERRRDSQCPQCGPLCGPRCGIIPLSGSVIRPLPASVPADIAGRPHSQPRGSPPFRPGRGQGVVHSPEAHRGATPPLKRPARTTISLADGRASAHRRALNRGRRSSPRRARHRSPDSRRGARWV